AQGHGVARRGRLPLQVDERVDLLAVPAGDEHGGEGIDEGVVRLAPAVPHQCEYRLTLRPLALARPDEPALLVAPMQHEMADPVRMAAGIGDRDRRAL